MVARSYPLVELWQYRRLIRQLAVRDLKVRYKVSVLGFFWSLLRPLLTIAVLAAVFSMLDELRSDRYSVSYPALLMAAYLPWFFFSATVLEGTQSLLSNAHLIKKVYSPRAVYPAAVVLSQSINFLLAMVVLVPVLLLFSEAQPTAWLLVLPGVIAFHILFTLGLCFLLSVVNVIVRDTTQIVEFVVFVWFYLSPVLYDIDIVRSFLGDSTWLYLLNPMAGLIEGYRFTLLASHYTGTEAVADLNALALGFALPYALVWSLAMVVAGYAALRYLETRAVDSL